MTELQGQSPALRLGGALAPPPPQLPPLLRALKLQAPLRRLGLRGCGLPDGAAGELLATLATLPALTHLDLAGNRLGPAGLRLLRPPRDGTRPPGAFQVMAWGGGDTGDVGDEGCGMGGHGMQEGDTGHGDAGHGDAGHGGTWGT